MVCTVALHALRAAVPPARVTLVSPLSSCRHIPLLTEIQKKCKKLRLLFFHPLFSTLAKVSTHISVLTGEVVFLINDAPRWLRRREFTIYGGFD